MKQGHRVGDRRGLGKGQGAARAEFALRWAAQREERGQREQLLKWARCR